MLTQNQLQQALVYDATTGVFTRATRSSNRIAVGDIAGSRDAKGYICICVGGKTYKAHRLAWLYVHGRWPQFEIDHINGIKCDNRIENLRDVDKSTNQQNRRATKGYSRDGSRWKAQIRAGNKWHHLGCFATEGEAHTAYLQAKQSFHVRARKE